MQLSFRLASRADHPRLEQMIIKSFAPITWFRKTDKVFGPFNGQDWRARWRRRLSHVFATQHVLVAESRGRIVACATGTLDPQTRLGYIDLLAVAPTRQGRGYGREMLRAMLRYMKDRGAEHANLECLADNDVGNALYRSEGFCEVARSVRWFIKIPE